MSLKSGIDFLELVLGAKQFPIALSALLATVSGAGCAIRICLYDHSTGAKDAGLKEQSPFGAES